ncbi:hypothetical protein GCM10022276_10530 [Sphingomonas limnosediminicola]|uniref:O-antigen ligase-related domain-containing protein n=1 Tax=Sphingomonas limnosediminicola TaxID=940133 RepID=A0ABP7L340_9SPHN
MKWVFIAGLVILVPLLIGLFRSNQKYLVYAAFAIGALPFVIVPHLYAAPYSWAGWQGTVKGIEVSLLDAVAVAVLFSTPKARIPLPLKLAFLLLMVGVAVSTAVAYQKLPALFYVWQLMRAGVLFVAVFRLCSAVPQAPLAMVAGAGLGLIYESILATRQYLSGDPRPGGNLGHSNFLGLSASMVTFPALSWALGGRRFLFPSLVVLGGLISGIVGGSRATLGLFGIGVVLTIALSLMHRRTSRKAAIAGTAFVLLVLSLPAMLWALDRRSAQDRQSSNEERTLMKRAAVMMITDHPLGVGANNYVLVANLGGYSERAGVPWNYANRSAPVHSAYYLVAAELGFLGLGGFVALLSTLLLYSIRAVGRTWPDQASELIPGFGASMIIVSIHVGYEWVFMHFDLHYVFAIASGIVVSLSARARAAVSKRVPVGVQLGGSMVRQGV